MDANENKGKMDFKKFSFKENFFVEQMNLLYKNLFASVPASLLCATIVFIALHRVSHIRWLGIWYAITIIISIVRLGVSGFYLYLHQHTKLFFYLFMITTLFAAMCWGFVGFFLMPANQLIAQMAVIIVLAGITAGGIQSLQPSLLAVLVYINFVILPLCLWLFLQKNIEYSIVGFAVVFYLLFTIIISWRGYQFLKKTLKLKYENIILTDEISETNKQLKQINQSLIEKENNLRLIHDHAPIGMAIVSLEGKWLNANSKLCEIVGYNKSEFENLTIQQVTYPDDLEVGVENQNKLLSGKISSYQVEKRYIHKNGKLIWILSNVSLVRDKEGKPFYFISQIQDINERKQNEQLISGLNHMNEMLQLCHDSMEAYPIVSQAAQNLFSELSGGMAMLNETTHEQETVERWGEKPLLKSFFNSVDCWAFRSGKTHFVESPKKNLLCQHFESSPPSSYICIPLIVQSQIIGLLNFSAAKNKMITHYQEQAINNFGEIIKLSLANIHLHESLREQAIHDSLTGLYNRRYLNEWLPQMVQHVIHTKNHLCVCMIDLDYFKRINDEYGHDVGDEVLKFVSQVLKNNFRDRDMACRFGGEEFVVVLVDTDLVHALPRMETIREKIKHAQITVKNHLLPSSSISIGIAEAPQHGESAQDLIRAADLALYTAKETGRDKIITASI